MNLHRRYLLGLLALLALLFNLERLDLGSENTLNLSSLVYLLAPSIVVVALAVPQSSRLGSGVASALWLSVYLTLSATLGARPLLGGTFTYLTISEMALLCGLVVLSHRLARSLSEFEESVGSLTLGEAGAASRTLDEAAEEARRALLLARRGERPLTVMVVKAAPEAEALEPARAVEKVQRAMLNRFLVNSMANVVADAIRRTDIPVQKAESGRLIVVCPDTDAATAATVIEHIRTDLSKKIGLSARFGCASFPDDGLGFEELIDRAERKIPSPNQPEPPIAPVERRDVGSQAEGRGLPQ